MIIMLEEKLFSRIKVNEAVHWILYKLYHRSE